MKAIETLYNGLRFRSRIEARWAVFYDTLGVGYQYEEQGFDLDGLYYLPDFWLPDYEVWIEIKGNGKISDGEKEKVRRLALETHYPALIFAGSFTSSRDLDFEPPMADHLWYYIDFLETQGEECIEFEENASDAGIGWWGYCTKCKKPVLEFGRAKNCKVIWPDDKTSKNLCGHHPSDFIATRPVYEAYLAARRTRFEFGESATRLANCLCPKCGARMRLRKPKRNQKWKAFYGCSRYPQCDGSRPV